MLITPPTLAAAAVLLGALWTVSLPAADQRPATSVGRNLEWIRPSADGTHFVRSDSGSRFVAWGLNYDHDAANRLLEDYWDKEWETVAADFQEMKALGANVARVHLQLARFMETPRDVNTNALNRLSRLVGLAEGTGLYLNITGLGCYRKKDVPAWYDAMDEAGRWDVQARFWSAVARVCASSPAVFCFDLMNEPILPGETKPEKEWLAGEFGGFHFVQRLTLDLAGRTRDEVARSWAGKLVAAIRAADQRHLITVGEIPWAHVFPGARPLFSRETGHGLDFVSVHFYPKKGGVAKALAALAVYDFGKPLLVEEMFPLECSIEELGAFVEGSSRIADGWIGFYWGKTIADYGRGETEIAGAITRRWLEYFRDHAPLVEPSERRGKP